MKTSLQNKLNYLLERHQELSALLMDSEIISNQELYPVLSREFAEIDPIAQEYTRYTQLDTEMSETRSLLDDPDPEMRSLCQQALEEAQQTLDTCKNQLMLLLLPKDPDDSRNVFLEIRAGTGGDEAAIFAGDLFRMYQRYAEQNNWKVEILRQRPGEQGGFKEIIARLEGHEVYACLKFESGTHRIQRVPQTESQGRIHTSACTLAVLPESDDPAEVEIDRADLRIDTYRASGAGGQHVNKTDSAVRLTHLPTGLVVECQDERSQHKNRTRALSLLRARLRERALASKQAEEAETRRNLVGSGDRSERIRTYNFPQGRITDHRISLTLYRLEEVMEGELNLIIKPLMQEQQADQLSAIEA